MEMANLIGAFRYYAKATKIMENSRHLNWFSCLDFKFLLHMKSKRYSVNTKQHTLNILHGNGLRFSKSILVKKLFYENSSPNLMLQTLTFINASK